jgi:integrase
MRQRITERVVSRKEPGEIWDELLPGFGLRIGARKRTFFVMGRCWSAKKGKIVQARRTVGTTIELTLGEARDKARTMLANFASGLDPEEAARAAKLEAARSRRNTFASIAADYMQEHGRHRKDAEERQRKLDKDILPEIGHIPVADLRRADIKALVLEKARETPVMAKRIKSLIHTVLNYAIDEELIDANPAARIKLQAETRRDRYLSSPEIRRFWRGIDKARLDPQMRRILKLLLTTAQRRSEVALMRWDELDIDGGVWELPADRTKAGRATRVPLSPLALELIGQPDGGEYVFHHKDGEPLTVYSVSQAMRRELKPLGLADKPATPHDLRRSAASQMGELGIDRLIIGIILNHKDPTLTGQVYDLSTRWKPKRAAMLAWSDKLIEITTGQEAPSNVKQLRAAQ